MGDVLNDRALQDLQQKLTDLKRQDAELLAIYTRKDEKVKKVEAQIAPLQAAFDAERVSIIEHIRNEYDSAVRREKLLEADYNAQSSVVTEQAGKSIQYNILKRDVDSNRQLYESTLQASEGGQCGLGNSGEQHPNCGSSQTAAPPVRVAPACLLTRWSGWWAGRCSGLSLF